MAGEPRFFGVYRGVCINVLDPEGRNRVTLRVPQVLGQEVTDWAWPCLPPGWREGLLKPHTAGTHTLLQTTPKPGEGVWVMFEAGDIDLPVWLGVF